MATEQEKELVGVAERNEMTMAVVGLSGQGKSTLVNSLLRIDPESEDAAETGDLGLPVSDDVVCYTRSRDNAKVTIWDTPGLLDEATMKTDTVIKLLRERAGDKLDLFLYCFAYRSGVRNHEVIKPEVIKVITKLFGTEVWRRALLVFTQVNEVKSKRNVLALAENIGNGVKYALREAGVPEDIVQNQRLILAGRGEEPLAISENEEIDWNERFFVRCLNAIQEERKRATFIQARYGRSFWKDFIDFWSLGSGKEKAATVAGGGAGVGIGAIVAAKASAFASSLSFAVGMGGTGVGTTGVGAATAGAATATGLTAGAVGTGGAAVGTLGGGAAAGAVGTTAMAGTGGTMAAATGSSAVAGALTAGTVATVATGVGAVAVGIVTVAIMANYFMSQKKKRKRKRKRA